MGFWESLKAGFLGAAGVDYYAKKTREEVQGLRADLRAPAQDPYDDPIAIQAAFGQVHQAIVELHEAMTDKAASDDEWFARVDLAFTDLVDVFGDLDRTFPLPSNHDPASEALVKHRRRAATAFRRAAEHWRAGETEDANQMVLQGKQEWNAMNDEVDRLSRQPGR